jgi:hypothetical protein
MAEAGAGGAGDVVREGLRRVVTRWGEPAGADAPAGVVWQNRLLDEVGSDRRGLVQLLLRVHADGLAAQIPRGPLDPAAWATIRARLAFGYASATYLNGDMARWAVDAWAYALGVIDARALYAPPPPPPTAPSLVAPRPAATAHQPAPATAAAAPGRLAAGHHGKLPGRVRRAVARANAPPAPNPFPANFDRLAGYAFAGMLTVAATAMWVGIAARREAGGLEVRAVAPVMDLSGAAPAPRGDGERGSGAREAGVAPAPPPAGDVALLDTLRLRDGTVRTGRVERITPAAILLRDVWADQVVPVALDEVLELRTRHGEVLPVGGRDSAGRDAVPDVTGTPGNPADASPAPDAPDSGRAEAERSPGSAHGFHATRAVGFGGRYAVRQEVLAVGGSESCDAVAAAVRRATTTVETLAHVPGASTFALTSRPGVEGTVDDEGRFETGVIEGVRDGVHYWFRMTGRFAGDGFQAETESATDAVLKFGSVQRCRVSAALDAHRVP